MYKLIDKSSFRTLKAKALKSENVNMGDPTKSTCSSGAKKLYSYFRSTKHKNKHTVVELNLFFLTSLL